MSDLISDDVRAFYEQHHKASEKYGASAAQYCGEAIVRELKDHGAKRVLDFGAGKGTLGEYINSYLPDVEVVNYDPCIDEISTLPPGRFDAVITCDVCEHIEPEHLDETLDLMCSKSDLQLHYVACYPTGGRMTDGRDLHLIVQAPAWWMAKFKDRGYRITHHEVQERRPKKKDRPAVFFVAEAS